MDDETNLEFSQVVERVTNFCRANRLRQFQFFGSPSVTVWRELRRLRNEDLESLGVEELTEIRDACTAGNWAEFVRLMGGPCAPLSTQKIRSIDLLRVKKREKNKYGETVSQLRGLIMITAAEQIRTVITRKNEWRMKQKSQSGSSLELLMHLERVEAAHLERIAHEAKNEAHVISYNQWISKMGAAGALLDNYQ